MKKTFIIWTYIVASIALNASIVRISDEVMQILKDDDYQKQYEQILKDHQVEIEDIYKEVVLKPRITEAGFDWETLQKEDPKELEDGLNELLAIDRENGVEIGPEFWVIQKIREDNKLIAKEGVKPEFTDKFFSGCYCDNGLRVQEIIEEKRGESDPHWALYQAGLRFHDGFGNFCLKRLLILANGQDPRFFWSQYSKLPPSPDKYEDAYEAAARRLKVAFQTLGGRYHAKGLHTKDDSSFKKGDLLYGAAQTAVHYH